MERDTPEVDTEDSCFKVRTEEKEVFGDWPNTLTNELTVSFNGIKKK